MQLRYILDVAAYFGWTVLRTDTHCCDVLHKILYMVHQSKRVVASLANMPLCQHVHGIVIPQQVR